MNPALAVGGVKSDMIPLSTIANAVESLAVATQLPGVANPSLILCDWPGRLFLPAISRDSAKHARLEAWLRQHPGAIGALERCESVRAAIEPCFSAGPEAVCLLLPLEGCASRPGA